MQAIEAKEPRAAAELVIDDLVRWVTPANADNLLAASRRPLSANEEPMVFMTRSEVEAMLRREKEKAPVSSIRLNLNSPFAAEVVVKMYPVG